MGLNNEEDKRRKMKGHFEMYDLIPTKQPFFLGEKDSFPELIINSNPNTTPTRKERLLEAIFTKRDTRNPDESQGIFMNTAELRTRLKQDYGERMAAYKKALHAMRAIEPTEYTRQAIQALEVAMLDEMLHQSSTFPFSMMKQEKLIMTYPIDSFLNEKPRDKIIPINLQPKDRKYKPYFP